MIDFKVKENLESMKKEQKLFSQLRELKKIDILVGIPEKKGKRRGEGKMNNATLLFIHTKGSPLNNLPPRPIIEPALTASDNAEKISADLKEIALAALNGQFPQAERLMKVTGQDAVNMIKNWFDDPRNGLQRNKPETVKAKLRKLGKRVLTAGERREMIEDYQAGVTGIDTVLVDTGQMRRAIDYVLRKRE